MKDWKNITIEDYQLLYSIITDENLDVFDREIKLVELITGKCEDEIEDMPFNLYKELRAKTDFLHDGKIEGKVLKKVKINERSYVFNLNANEFRFGRYVDFTTFVKDENALVGNLHLLMASLAIPCKRTWWGGLKKLKYGDVDHKIVASDMLKVNFADCYTTCVFFCNLIDNLIKVTLRYSVKEILKSGKMTKDQIREALKPLRNDGDGFTTLNLLQSLNELK